MYRVLVVDDAKAIRDLLTKVLQASGFKATCVADVPEAFTLLMSERFDAVVLDVEIPNQSGLDCLVAIRAMPTLARIPVVMMTATPLRDVIVRIAHIGVQGILAKTSDLPVQLLRRLREALPTQTEGPNLSVEDPNFPTAPTHATKVHAPHSILAPAHMPDRPRPPVPTRSSDEHMSAQHGALGNEREEVGLPGQTITSAADADRERARDDAESLRVCLIHVDSLPDPERAVEELKRLRPLMSRTELWDRVIEGSDPKALRPVVQQVLSLTGTTSSSVDTIARAIKQDQGLSLKVLKVANSSLYTRGERVETVHKAVARIGITQIRTTVLSLSVVDQFASVNLANRIRADWFWEHSLATGLLAAHLTTLQGGTPAAADTMFTAGLLHDVGRVLFAERLGEIYAGVIDVADRLELPLETVESRLLLVNHADLTDRLLRAWNFSPELINPIALHHLSVGNIRRIVPRSAESVATLCLANGLAHCLMLGSSGNQSLYPIEEYLEFLNISTTALQSLCSSIVEETLDLKLTMLSHGGTPKPSVLDEAKEQLHGELCPLLVALEPGTDAVGILLNRICGSSCEKPNVVVIRSRHARERSELMTKLQAAEKDAGVSGLPTLVIGNGAGCYFAEGWLGSRRIEQLSIPCRVGRIIRALAGLLAPSNAIPAKKAA